MSCLFAGFGRVKLYPMIGIGIRGYCVKRYAEGILDDLEINALALACGNQKAVILSMDNSNIKKNVAAELKQYLSKTTGLAEESFFIHATHTHTAPYLVQDAKNDMQRQYYQQVLHKMGEVAMQALEDLKPAQMGWGIGQAPGIAFVRRYRMKDGSIRTNPGVDNPDIFESLGQADERVSVVRFDQEEGESLVLVNFAAHPDTVGGSKISADWPGFLRRYVEQAIDNTRCIFLNGAQGDINHVNVHPRGGDMNDMNLDFDDVSRGYGHARHMGRVVAGAVMQVYDKVKYVGVDSLTFCQKTIRIPSNMPKPEELPEAHRIHKLRLEGKENELPYTGMMLTTVLTDAARMVRLENGPEYFDMDLSAVTVGPVAFIGFPGEPFSGIGSAMKETTGWDLVLPCCLVNGSEGYFPTNEAYDEGGYEVRCSNFRAGVAELLIKEGKEMLNGLCQ